MRRLNPGSRRARAMTKWKACSIVVVLLALSGCKVGPNYQRPQLDIPGGYRGVAPEAAPDKTAAPSPLETVPPEAGQQPGAPPTSQPTTSSESTPQPGQQQQPTQAMPAGQSGQRFGDMEWTAVFQDEALQGLIKEALANNYDIRVAAT